jgi:hypothetical protein
MVHFRRTRDWRQTIQEHCPTQPLYEEVGLILTNNVNHSTDRRRLQEAFSTLFRSENDGLVQKLPPKIDIASDESILRDTSNRFALLNNPSEEIEDFQSTQSSGITSQGAFEDGEEKSQSSFCPVLQDDPIEALIEIHLVVRVSSNREIFALDYSIYEY